MNDTHVLQFFGRRLRKARQRAYLSQADLAQRLGVGQDTISHYEKGHCRPDVIMLWQIAYLLRVEVGYFFPEERFMSLTAEDRETLAMLESFSPSALKYILAFIQAFGLHQQRRQFLTEDRLGFEPQTALLIGLERDLTTFEATLKQETQSGRLEALVRLTTLLVMSLDVTHGTTDMEDIARRIAACSQRLIHQMTKPGSVA